MLVGYGNAVNVLLAGHLLFLLAVVAQGAFVQQVGEAQDYHEVVNELDLDPQLHYYGRVGNLLYFCLSVLEDHSFGEVKEEVKEAVVEGKYQSGSLDQMVQVGVLASTHSDTLAALVGVKLLFCGEPLFLELFVQTVHL